MVTLLITSFFVKTRSLFFELSFELSSGTIALDICDHYLDRRFQVLRTETCWTAGWPKASLGGRAGVGSLVTGIMVRFWLLYSKLGY
jgi:hypothetical protein